MDYYTRQESDTAHAEIRGAVTTEIQALQNVIKTQMEGLATKGDMATIHASQKKIMEFMQNVDVGVGVLKFSWNNSAKIGGFLLILFGFFIFLKVGIAGVIAYFYK